MRRFTLLLLVALAGGCGWDGPPRDVRVVTSDPATPALPAADGSGSGADATATGGPDPSTPPADPLVPGLEERPGTFTRLDLPATVAVVGDSLTVAASDEITEALSSIGVRAVIVDGRESRRMTSGTSDRPSGISAIEGILDGRRPDLWVVALGTNDVGAAVDVDRFRTDVREILAAIPSGAPVVWVDVWIRDRLDAVVEANAGLRRELADRWGPTAVVDWFASGSVDGVITDDGVHLTGPGQARFAAEIADAVVALAVSTS